MANIYEFENPADYLNQVWIEKKDNNPLYSIRAWAKQLGFSKHTIMYEIIQKRRNISTRYIPALTENLCLNLHEKNYFEALVNLQKAHNDEEKKYYKDKVDKLRAIGLMEFIELEDFTPLRDPLYSLIMVKLTDSDFEGTVEELHKSLRIKRSLGQVEKAVNDLLEYKLLEKTDTGYKKISDLVSSKRDVPCSAVKQFHRSMLSEAKEQIMVQPIDEREFNSFLLNIDKGSIPRAKQLIRNFINSFIKDMEISTDNAKNKETYNLGIQLFSLTQSEDQPHE